MKKTVALFGAIILLLILGGWILLKEDVEINTIDTQQQITVDSNNNDTDALNQFDKITSEPEAQNENLNKNQNDLFYSYLDARSFTSPYSQKQVNDKPLVIENESFLVVQELAKENSNTSFKLLIANNQTNKAELQKETESPECFNDDLFFSRHNLMLSIWENTKLSYLDRDVLQEIDNAPNGCTLAVKWIDDSIVFNKQANGGNEILFYSTKTNTLEKKVRYELWFTGGLGSGSGNQLVWSTPQGTFFQNQTKESAFSDSYKLLPGEILQYSQYQDELPTNSLAYKTNGYLAWADLLDNSVLQNLEKGLSFTINDQKVFLPW